ncbi:MAG: hypothetical protein ACM3JG_19680 [Thiohalocapsa sp.]
MAERARFQLGLVMAGAISAGAYTAGVLDFLLEALDAIEDVRAGRPAQYLETSEPDSKPVFDPPHRLCLKALSGTSAGAMVTAILTTVLGTRIPHVGPGRRWDDDTPTGNPLYDAWVEQIHWDKLLSTDDLAGGVPVRSLLNARHLDGIVADALRYAERVDYPRPYVMPRLPVYLCVGNLRGVRYSLSLEVDKDVVNEHQMSMHADWLGFCYDRDANASRPGMRSLAPGGHPDRWHLLGGAALASGAFPVGLSARALQRPFNDYVERRWYDPGKLLRPQRRQVDGHDAEPACNPDSWLSEAGGSRKLKPLDAPTDFRDGDYDFVNVDGGVFNNEPLELCRVAVADGKGHNPRDGREADRAVLLIDPFPNLFDRDDHYDPLAQQQLLLVLQHLMAAFISQSRFKPDELALARDPQVASRYAIMPVRYGAGDVAEKYAIACGSLGGFGGFLSKAFRHHDFMLGRRNCQRFLACHFVLPADPGKGHLNPLFAGWTDAATRAPFVVRAPLAVDGRIVENVEHLPILPLLGKLACSAYTATPAWPVDPSDLTIDAIRVAIAARADAVKDSLVAQYRPDWVLRQGIGVLWAWNRWKWIEQKAIAPILANFRQRGLLTDA